MFAVIIVSLSFCLMKHLMGVSKEKTEAEARAFHNIDESWQSIQATNDDVSAMLFFPADRSSHFYSIYCKHKGLSKGFFFRIGGTISEISSECVQFVFEDNNSQIYASMNKQKICKVEIDDGSGFCFGVVTAIHKAEEELAKGETLYCLGDIVHNSREVDRLKTMGLITINREEFKQLKNAKVLLRAHGEPPETYMIARENNIEIIDATCPVVLRLQKRIRQGYLADSDEEKQIVIYGKSGHAEVLGLVGQTDGKAIVIEKAEEAKKLDLNKSIRLFSQTTKSLDEFQEIVEYFKQHISPEATFEYYDTICRQVANRMPKLREFAATHDLIFFVSGKKSSNGKMLFEECLKVNANSHLIDNEKEIDPSLLQNVKSIGVCGATSTPKWLMEKIYNHIRTLIKE